MSKMTSTFSSPAELRISRLLVEINQFLVDKDVLILAIITLIDNVLSELGYGNLNIRAINAHLFPDNLILRILLEILVN